MKLIVRLLALVMLVGPPVYLAYDPKAYTPLVDTLFSVFLFGLAFWIGRDAEVAAAVKRANDRWLPQAESVTYRLLTLFTNVRGFSLSARASCSSSNCDLPELQTAELRAVRVKLKTECDAYAQRLDDIGYQLEDAIGDWQRFIAANCQGAECSRIFEAIMERKMRLLGERPQSIEAAKNPFIPDQNPLS